MNLSDDVPNPASDPDRVRPRRDPNKLVREPESPPPEPVNRVKSFFLTIWYLITGKYNL